MDTIIQSQCQSAIVQKLSETEHNLKRFTKDIPDNAPIMSHETAEIKPYIGDVSQRTGTVRFKVPRRGYLNRMWLKVRAEASHEFETSNAITYRSQKGRGCEKFLNFFESASLFVNGKRVETLLGESVIYNSLTHNWLVSHHLMRGLTGFRHIYASGEPGLEFGKPNEFSVGSGDLDNASADYLVPLEFSMFRFFKDSIDTNFIGNIEVEFVKREMKTLSVEGDKVYASLVCKYHNVLNHFRTNLRNANFPKETSSFLLTDSERLLSEPTFVNGTAIDGFNNGIYTFSVPNLNDVSDIMVTFSRPNIDQNTAYQGEYQPGWSAYGYLKFTLKANGVTLIDKFDHELVHPGYDVSGQNIPDLAKPELALISFGDYSLEDSVYHSGTGPYDTAKEDLAFHYAHHTTPFLLIPLQMFGTDEFYCGGINTQSLTNVEIILESTSFTSEGSTSSSAYTRMRPHVSFRTKSVARIDTKTGMVSV